MDKIEAPVEVERALEELALANPERVDWRLAQWIYNWSLLPDEIGNYRGSLSDEYINDLGYRTHIHLVLTLAHDAKALEILEWALPLVEATDARFLSKTSPDVEGLMWGGYLEPYAWWRRRVPNDEGLLENFRLFADSRRSQPY